MKARWLAASMSGALLMLTGCFQEAEIERPIGYSVVVEFEDMRSTISYPQTLTIGPTDVKEMEATRSEFYGSYRSFYIRTNIVVDNVNQVNYCLVEPIVITSAATGAVDHTIPAGTCLADKSTLEIQIPGAPVANR